MKTYKAWELSPCPFCRAKKGELCKWKPQFAPIMGSVSHLSRARAVVANNLGVALADDEFDRFRDD